MNRRALLRAGGATVTSALAAGSAGCFYYYPTGGSGGGSGGGQGSQLSGRVPGGGVPSLQEYTQSDAAHSARSVEELKRHASATDGRIVWLPNESYDFTGQDLHLTGNITLASSRSPDSPGAVLHTSDEGASSPAWSGGSGTGLISIPGDNVTLSGVELRGPHTNEEDHHALAGYFPFAPGSSRSARDRWRRQRYARGVTITGDNVTISNCDIHGFGVQGISVGNSERAPQNVTIAYCSLTNFLMTSYGYCVDVRHGDVQLYRTYMDAARHHIVTSGMGDANYNALECTFGPWCTSHPIDSHRVGENQSGSSDPSARDYTYRAGGRLVVKGSLVLANRVPDLGFINFSRGSTVPHVRVRGVPGDGFYFEGNKCSHAGIEAGIEQSQDGIPGRLETDEYGFANMYISGNEWDVNFDALGRIP